MNPAADLQRAFTPLVERAKRRAERIHQLSAQPPTPERDKSIAAEQREIDLIKQVAAATSRVVESVTQYAEAATAQAQQVIGRVQTVAEDASHYEALFERAITLNPVDLPDDQVPPLLLRGYAAMIRMQHMRTSPDTYAQTYPAPFANPTP